MARIAAAGGPTKTRPAPRANLGEIGVLGEKAVARMDGFGAGRLRGVDERSDRQVGLRRSRGAEADRSVREPNVQRVLRPRR